MGTASTKAKNKYNKQNYEQIVLAVPIGTKERIDAAMQRVGEKSRTKYVLDAIERRIASENEEEIEE